MNQTRVLHIPHNHDSKFGKCDGDPDIQAEHVKQNLSTIVAMSITEDKKWEENLTISIRSKDTNGKWLSGTMTTQLSALKAGDEIIIDGNNLSHRIMKLIVVEKDAEIIDKL